MDSQQRPFWIVYWLLMPEYDTVQQLLIILSLIKLVKITTLANTRCLIILKHAIFACGNLFSKNNRTLEFIFEEKGLFKTSENKNPSKITSYMVYLQEETNVVFIAPCSLLKLESILYCKCPPPSAPHIPNFSTTA